MREKNSNLIAIFTQSGFLLDTEATNDTCYYANDELLATFKTEAYKALFSFGFENKPKYMSQSLLFLHGIAAFFAEKLSKNPDIEITHSAPALTEDEIDSILQKVPYTTGAEFVDSKWITTLWDKLNHVFKTELSCFDESATQYLLTHNSHINIAGRVFFHLVENKNDEYPFAFIATYSRESASHNKAEHVPLRNALIEYKDNQELLLQLLSTVSRATDKSSFISELVESGELFSPLQFTTNEAYQFLKEIPLYEECGIMCRMPDWWKKKYNSVKVNIAIGKTTPPRVGLDAILSFDPTLSLAGEELARDDIEAMLSQTAGLSLLKGRWVEIDHEKLRAVLETYDKAVTMAGDMTFVDAMRFQMGLSDIKGLQSADDLEISNGQWLSSIWNKLKKTEKLTNISAGNDFKATLRHYQQNGLDWLATMKHTGFGALLADDMGLGKTVQILAFLEYMRQNGDFKALIILPASLIGNWCNEIEKFTPKIRYHVLHSTDTQIELKNADVFITTYGMALRIMPLKEYTWDIVILDEAQAIKNPGTKQTKAVKAIPAKFHIAMTGTPVENKMSDLWSLFDFLNAGLLGTSKEFSDYSKKIQSGEAYTKLKNTINPFILRRLKTDKNIIHDLPEKVEMKTYATLSKKQAVLYTALVKEIEQTIDNLAGINRKGLVLASLIKFKQICNHPDQYLGQHVFDHAYSGKFHVLSEICETIRDKHERVLVFTQFREMCTPLSDYLETLFGKKGVVLHGGTPVKRRTEIVDKLNGDEYVPYMVLSLKAGGVGLNLTAANHIIHFDRWWNPAVENQATDRAFRIGQQKNVLVHKFITTGTIEEKIDKMIEDKMKLSKELIASSGENWITEMSNKELLNLFTLNG